MSDIKFDGNSVVVEGTFLKSQTTDLMLDAPSRRKVSGGNRRALVHDFDDGLTVNWANDYPAGVTINSTKQINGNNNNDWLNVNSRVTKFIGTDLMLDSPSRRKTNTTYRRALVHDFNDGLTINWASDYPGGVTINGAVKIPSKLTIGAVDVGSVIATLLDKINKLESRVAALEAKVP